MTRPSKRLVLAVFTCATVAAVILIWRRVPTTPPRTETPSTGGALVASHRSEPTTFNRMLGNQAADELFARLTQARLVRINRVTDVLEPRLAERWTTTDDGLAYALTLRQGVRFSDGAPFTAADVLFSFEVAYDAASRMASDFTVAGQPLAVSASDDWTVNIRFPAPYAPGLRMVDALPILPRHRLEAAFREGRLREAWGTATPPEDLAGLGPFVLTRYLPGQRLVFERNPHFWNLDASGVRLPYLDRLSLEIIPEQNTELLRLEAGELDLITDQVRAEDVAPFRQAALAGQLQLVDVGVSPDANLLWFNLRPDTQWSATRRAWLQSETFRKAISHAVDRQAFVDTVYLGAAVPIHGPVTPGHGSWYAPNLPGYDYDPDGARALLDDLNLADRDGDGMLEDPSGEPVRFSVITQQGNDVRQRGAAVIQDGLRAIGVAVDIVGLDVGGLVQRFGAGDYDAIFFGVDTTDIDPASTTAFWFSSGAFHFWNPGQATPATDWEARIDDLMRRQIVTMDVEERRRLFTEVQRIFAEHVPALYFAAPEVYIAMSSRVVHATPALARPQVLWNAEAIAVREDRTP